MKNDVEAKKGVGAKKGVEVEVEQIMEGLTGDYRIGEAYHVRTVTDHWIGVVEKVTQDFVYLTQASWIPRTGRFTDFCAGTAEPKEVEIVGDIAIKKDVICSLIVWKNKIPTEPR
jgi:hypothetical protein